MATQGAVAQTPTIAGSGTVNFVPRFVTNTTTIGNSAMAQFNTNRIGINTSTPQSVLELYNSCENPLKPSFVISHQASCFAPANVGDFIRVQNGASTRFIVTNLGRVGVGGITTPTTAQFEVQPIGSVNIADFRNTSAVSVFTIANTGNVSANTGNLSVATGNLLVTSGRLGIGVASPTARVEVDYTTFTDALRIKAGSFTGFLIQNEKVGINVSSLANLGTLTVKNADNNGNALDLVANTTTPVGQGWINQIRMSTNSGYRHSIVDDGNTGKLIINTGVGAGATNILQVNGRLQVGTLAPDVSVYPNWRMGVDGDIVAKRVIVQTASWADKVFSENYNLKPLSQLEDYIKANKHLPEIPTEAEVMEKGIDVGEVNKLLLQKIEELTLYLIAQQKQIDELTK